MVAVASMAAARAAAARAVEREVAAKEVAAKAAEGTAVAMETAARGVTKEVPRCNCMQIHSRDQRGRRAKLHRPGA